tara:strand:- start:67 stop:639 length:573 start_codon:yes stop_codon:yes gene_type:complete
MNNEVIISVDNLSYKINENRLFHNLSFVLKKGEALHIVGSNGSGKSTLLRIILGITSQTKGTIKSNIESQVCYLGHKNALKNYLTLEDNISIMELNDIKKLQNYIEALDLKKYMDVNVANLSFGQQKKLALLRIFCNESELIILDEPFVGLDKITTELLSEFLSSELTRGKGIIFTSHIKSSITSNIIEI